MSEDKFKDFNKEIAILSQNIRGLNENLAKEVSFKYNLLLSIIKGAGYVIGATVIASLIIAILVKTFERIPILKNINLDKIEQQK